MKKYYKKIFKRNDNKNLLLFSTVKNQEKNMKELEITNIVSPHMRWHPFRQEWITYSSEREKSESLSPIILSSKFTLICSFEYHHL